MLIRKLELMMENCEMITIEGKYIGQFFAGEIKRSICRMGCNHICIMDVCHEFGIEIHKDANKKHAPFGEQKWETFTFDRLTQCNDITSIAIYLYDQYNDEARDDTSKDIVEHYYIHWDGDDDYNNPSQHSKIAKTGWLYMTIGQNLNIDEIFPSEEVDNEEYSDFHSSMLDIGDKYWAEHEELLRNRSNDIDENESNN